MVLPNFLVLGAPKTGTQSLYEYLKKHPQIYASPLKEPNFFAFEKQPDYTGPKDDEAWTNVYSVVELAAYQELFSGVIDEKAIGEFSTMYLYLEKTPQRIHHYVPDMKMMAIVRQPVDRAFSHYLHLRAVGREWLTDFREAFFRSRDRAANYWAPAWHYEQVGCYSEQIKRYFQYFDTQQLKIILYDDWKANPQKIISEILQFLEVDTNWTPDMSARYNTRTIVWKNNRLRDFLLKENPVKSLLRSVIPAEIRKPLSTKVLKNNMQKPPSLDPQIRQELTEYYLEEILQLQEVIKRDLSMWLK